MANKTAEKQEVDREKGGSRDQAGAEVSAELGHTEQISHDEERVRRNQEWSPAQDTGYQTGGGPHSEEEAEEASKTAESTT